MYLKFFRNNGLTLVLLSVFLGSWAAQLFTGHRDHNNELADDSKLPVSLTEYILDGAFWQATGENWESEFLQMAMFVLLTRCLYQKGSPESRDPDDLAADGLDEDPVTKQFDKDAPWPVLRDIPLVWLYSHSLSICFVALFLASMWIHAAGGVRVYNEEQAAHGNAIISTLDYLKTSRFWFESFQNWQSEFLSLAAMVWLSVYLRERGSAESKPVEASHSDHGA